jgi:hypothetical protein
MRYVSLAKDEIVNAKREKKVFDKQIRQVRGRVPDRLRRPRQGSREATLRSAVDAPERPRRDPGLTHDRALHRPRRPAPAPKAVAWHSAKPAAIAPAPAPKAAAPKAEVAQAPKGQPSSIPPAALKPAAPQVARPVAATATATRSEEAKALLDGLKAALVRRARPRAEEGRAGREAELKKAEARSQAERSRSRRPEPKVKAERRGREAEPKPVAKTGREEAEMKKSVLDPGPRHGEGRRAGQAGRKRRAEARRRAEAGGRAGRPRPLGRGNACSTRSGPRRSPPPSRRPPPRRRFPPREDGGAWIPRPGPAQGPRRSFMAKVAGSTRSGNIFPAADKHEMKSARLRCARAPACRREVPGNEEVQGFPARHGRPRHAVRDGLQRMNNVFHERSGGMVASVSPMVLKPVFTGTDETRSSPRPPSPRPASRSPT